WGTQQKRRINWVGFRRLPCRRCVPRWFRKICWLRSAMPCSRPTATMFRYQWRTKVAELRDQKVFVAGHRGMVGSAIVRRLETLGYPTILTAGRDELNLLDQAAVHAWFAEHRPEQVYIAAAKVGGIHANNTYPAEFIYENLMIEANLIHAAHQA